MTEDHLRLETVACFALAMTMAQEGMFAPFARFWNGANWLTGHIPEPPEDNDAGKDFRFTLLREYVAREKHGAVIIVSDANFSVSTPKALNNMEKEDFFRLSRMHGTEWMERRGYLVTRDAFIAIAQTPEVVGMMNQFYSMEEDGTITLEEMTPWDSMPQAAFDTRSKMFGEVPGKGVDGWTYEDPTMEAVGSILADVAFSAVDTPDDHCPSCGAEMNRVSQAGVQPGSASICAYCLTLLIFGDDLRLRLPTLMESLAMDGDPRLPALRAALKATFPRLGKKT